MEPRSITIVMASIPPEKEEEFNRWYNEDHFQKAVKAPGKTGGRRFKILETRAINSRSNMEGMAPFRFMAIYEFETDAAAEAHLNSAQFKKNVAEFTAAWPESERFVIRAVQIYP